MSNVVFTFTPQYCVKVITCFKTKVFNLNGQYSTRKHDKQECRRVRFLNKISKQNQSIRKYGTRKNCSGLWCILSVQYYDLILYINVYQTRQI